MALTALSAPVAPVAGFIGLASKLDLEIKRKYGAVRLIFGPSLPVSAGRTLQHPEVLMTCDSCHLHHAQTFLEETRCRLMSEVVKPQVGDVA